MKEEFLALLRKTNREGIEELINFLEKSDFFVAPASTRFHGNFEGGLAAHSMKVYEILKHKVENSVIDVEIKEESIILIGLLHDICKTNFYKVDYRNAKNALGVWEKVPYYTVDDTIPYGHGEKSVMMITEYMKLTPEEKLISDDFAKNRGKLPWPVEQGFVSEKFGVNVHPVFKQVKLNNAGITITTSRNADVRAVFKGVVTEIMFIPGDNNVVIVRHGNYLTVYSNLVEIFIKKGDTVNVKQKIGKLAVSSGNNSTLNFQVWRDKDNLDPQLWLTPW